MKKDRRPRKHSHIDWVSMVYERQRAFLPFDPGYPGGDAKHRRSTDFSFNQDPPIEMIAYLWRRFVSLRDALTYYKRDDPGLPGGVTKANGIAELRTCYRILEELNAEIDRFHAQLADAMAPIYAAKRIPTKAEAAHVRLVRKKSAALDRRRRENSDRGSRIVRTLSRPIRSEVTGTILAALGIYPFDYASARQVLEEWCAASLRDMGCQSFTFGPHSDLRHDVGRGLQWTIAPLIDLFENPSRFFADVLPSLYPTDAREDWLRGWWHLSTSTDGSPNWPYVPLAEALHRWGYGLLLNETVRRTFDEAAREPTFALVLAQAEGREPFRDLGRKPRVDLDLEAELSSYEAAGRGRREAWILHRAKQLGLEESTIRRYLAEARRQRRSVKK